MVGDNRSFFKDNRGADIASQVIDRGDLTIIMQCVRVESTDVEQDLNKDLEAAKVLSRREDEFGTYNLTRFVSLD